MMRVRKLFHLSDFVEAAEKSGPPTARVSVRSPDEEVWLSGWISPDLPTGSSNWPTRPLQREIY